MIYLPKNPLTGHKRRIYSTKPRFGVKVNGESCDIRLTRESKNPFNRVWPGYQRARCQSEQGEYVMIFGTGEINVEITVPEDKKDTNQVIVRPQRCGIIPELKDGVISLNIKENGYYSVECGADCTSIHDSIQIFYCKPLEDDGGASANIKFDAGVHYAGRIHVKAGDKIYIHPEAVVYGAILGEDADNVEIYGGGVIDDSTEERIFENCYDPNVGGCIRFYRSNNIKINDVICLNASNWVISTFDCDDVHIDGVKILGQWRYNTDGIDLVNASHSSIRNSFVRSFDDTIVIKALYQHPLVTDIVVENCVLWCCWGKNLEIGLETSADEYSNIYFKNNDLIHNSYGAMTVSNGNYAHVHDVYYENITVEYSKTEEPEIYQAKEEQVYTGSAPKPVTANLIGMANFRIYDCAPVDIAGDKALIYGTIDNVYYKNIQVYTDMPDGKINALLDNRVQGTNFDNIAINGLYINGEKQENFDKIAFNAQNCRLPVLK